ncbi:uncharacterized protein LOC143280149 [Babylonia areolata]|uniref:uncharacterized protein LOC143280149 n=1 Tax=Babylonia areolata TaxID=304850 RepID=UPI003FD2018F
MVATHGPQHLTIDISGAMSGFVSKISAAGSKGWTGLQSLWDRDNKTQLTSSSTGHPAEKTSLLSLALPSRHPKGSRLLSEDDDWMDNSPPGDGHDMAGNGASSSSSSSSTNITTTVNPTPTITTATTTSSPRCQTKAAELAPPPPAEWSWVGEEEGDEWLKGDSAHRGILDTDKKKSTRESKRPSPRFKHKMAASSSTKGNDWKHGGERERGFSALGKLKGPQFGKLLDTDCEEGDGGRGSASTGCENSVWADDDDDDSDDPWKMMDNRAGGPKGK